MMFRPSIWFQILAGIFDNIILTIRENPVRTFWLTLFLTLTIWWF